MALPISNSLETSTLDVNTFSIGIALQYGDSGATRQEPFLKSYG